MEFGYAPRERPDWGYARNRFTAVKDADATWSQAVFSATIGDYTVPNRDYPYQGLCRVTDDGYWKFLDALGLRVLAEGEDLALEPGHVRAAPDAATYAYETERGAVTATYRLTGKGAAVDVHTELDTDSATILVAPLVDIRPVTAGSPDDVDVHEQDGSLVIAANGKQVAVAPGAHHVDRERVTWDYKLGSGSRASDGAVRFAGETRSPVLVERLAVDAPSATFGIAMGADADAAAAKKAASAPTDGSPAFTARTGDAELDRWLEARIATLPRHNTRTGNLDVPAAGDFWFRQVWTRDLLFGLFENMAVYEEVAGADWVRDVLQWVSLFRRDGLLPVQVPGDGDVAVDAGLLYLLCVSRFAERNGEEDRFADRFRETFDRYQEMVQDGLLVTGADASWTDTYRVVDGTRVSTRVPDAWTRELDEPAAPHYALPELNAYWVRACDAAERFGVAADPDGAREAFRDVFGDRLPANLVFLDGKTVRTDDTPTSMAVEAVTRLPGMERDLDAVWETVSDRLVVERTPELRETGRGPFGLKTKDSERVLFRGDDEYHEAVVWLRESTHLLRLARMRGDDETARRVAENVLDHQMSEGAVLYGHELFALPEGDNPDPGDFADNPVPVKNPVQYWSHFVEPLKEVLEG